MSERGKIQEAALAGAEEHIKELEAEVYALRSDFGRTDF